MFNENFGITFNRKLNVKIESRIIFFSGTFNVLSFYDFTYIWVTRTHAA